MRETCVLVVESDNDERRRISEWLDGAGYDVMFCPGPGEPDYVCLGGRGIACPLVDAADTVVLNLQLRSDVAMAGTPGWQLLLYYRQLGKRIVAFAGAGDDLLPIAEDQVSVIRRPVERGSLMAALQSFAPPTRAHGGGHNGHGLAR